MKSPQEFRVGIYDKYEEQTRRRKKILHRALAVIPLALVLLVTGIGLPRLLQTGSTDRSGSEAYVARGTASADEPNGTLSIPLLRLAARPLEIPDLLDFHDDLSFEERELLQERAAIATDFSEAMNLFARDTAEVLTDSVISGQANACYSPVSIYYAMALAGAGAKGETKQEILDLLHAPDWDWLTEQCEKYYRQHYHDNDSSTFMLANSLWLRGDIDFRQSFLDTAGDSFFASLFQADFSDPALAGEMTRWVSENTGGLLEPEFEFDADTVMEIVNTVYFKGMWNEAFDKENNTLEDFTREDGSVTQAEFMHGYETFGSAFFGNGFVRASLPMRSGAEMILILPDESVTPRDLLKDPAAYADMFFPKSYDEYEDCQISWTVPKFDFEYNTDLTDALYRLGVRHAWDPFSADFSDIADAEYSLYLSKAQHGTHIKVDEDGVEAAAYTELAWGAGASLPPEKRIEMRLDRPFLFAICSYDHTEEGWEAYGRNSSLLFVGMVGDPG